MRQPDIFMRMITKNLIIVADLLNFIIFGGEERVKPEDLLPLPESQAFKDSKGQWRELKRDAFVLWREGNMIFSFIGLESQSYIDPDMPLRGFAYDGESYKEQIINAPNGERYPVITFVLYYDEKPWTKNLTLRERLNIPNEFSILIAPYFNDYRINVIDIRRLTLEEAQKFRSVLSFIVSVGQMFDRQIKDVNLPAVSTYEERILASEFLKVFFKTEDTSWISLDKLEARRICHERFSGDYGNFSSQ